MLAGVFAFGWVVLPGFGAIDLAVTWNPEWEQVLEAGWGLYFTVIVGVPFVVTAVRPRASRPGIVQLVAATVVAPFQPRREARRRADTCSVPAPSSMSVRVLSAEPELESCEVARAGLESATPRFSAECSTN